MRHVVTSFQLLNRTFNMGPVFQSQTPISRAATTCRQVRFSGHFSFWTFIGQ